MLTSFPHSDLSSYPQLITWMASLRKEPGPADFGTPPLSRCVDATNTGYWSNLFSKFFTNINDDFSSSIPVFAITWISPHYLSEAHEFPVLKPQCLAIIHLNTQKKHSQYIIQLTHASLPPQHKLLPPSIPSAISLRPNIGVFDPSLTVPSSFEDASQTWAFWDSYENHSTIVESSCNYTYFFVLYWWLISIQCLSSERTFCTHICWTLDSIQTFHICLH